MNLIKGIIQEIYVREGTTIARVSVKGAQMRVPLYFLPEAGVGDEVLVESGVAISRVEPEKVGDL